MVTEKIITKIYTKGMKRKQNTYYKSQLNTKEGSNGENERGKSIRHTENI